MDRCNNTRVAISALMLCFGHIGLAVNNHANADDPGEADVVDVIMVYDANPDEAEKDRVQGLGAEAGNAER